MHAYGEIDGRLYLDMRVVDGHRPAQEVLGDGPIRPRRALDVLGQVASALDAAVEAGLVHRDIKPSNILLDANEFAYLTDFGIATIRVAGSHVDDAVRALHRHDGTTSRRSGCESAVRSTVARTSTRWPACCTSASLVTGRFPATL